MKKALLLVLLLVFCASTGLFSQELKGKKVKALPFFVYTDAMNKANHFIPSGWMGDTGDLKMSDKWATNPKTGKTCIQIKYSGEKKQSAGWAGIYWQNPANNWGNSKGGFDLTGATELSFWARGEKGGEMVEFKYGGIAGEFPDSSSGSSDTVELSKQWKQFKIDLKDQDMSYINGGFCVVFPGDANPDGLIMYIDEIVYSRGK